MNIAYFHIGTSLELPEMLCKSAKTAFSGRKLKITQLSDFETPKANSADKIVRFNSTAGLGMQYFRMTTYKDFLEKNPEPTIFLDTDMLIIKPFDLDFNSGPVLCARSYNLEEEVIETTNTPTHKNVAFPEHAGQNFQSLYPFLGCFFADKDHSFLSRSLEIYDKLGENYKLWYGDQVALREAAKELLYNAVPEAIVAADPRIKDSFSNAFCLHFKGIKLKPKMIEVFNKLSPDTDKNRFTKSYRSNPKKEGYEIPETLNSYFSEYLIGASSTNCTFIPSDILDIGERADIICKIMLLLSTKENLLPRQIGLSAYAKHLNALNTCNGKDSPEKNGILDYLTSFSDLFDSVKRAGAFDRNKSVIPINYEMKVIDGAHRASIGILLGIKIPTVELPAAKVPKITIHELTSRFGLSRDEYLHALRTYLRFNKSSRIIVLFPCRDNTLDKDCMSLISRYLRIDGKVEKEVRSVMDSRVLVSLLYAGQDWIRGKVSGMDALTFKAKRTHKNDEPATFLVVTPYSRHQEFSSQKHKDLKELCRSKYSMGFHSLHGTDCREDNLLLFDNYLLNKQPSVPPGGSFVVDTSLINKDQANALEYISGLDLSMRERIIISGGMVLTCTGLRPSSDVDIITDIEDLAVGTSHNNFITRWSRYSSYKEIISDPTKTFWMRYKNKIIRFLSYSELLDIKTRRFKSNSSEKDRNDIELLSRLSSP